MELAQLLKEYGPWVVLVGVFTWWTWKREQHLAGRITILEDREYKDTAELAREMAEVVRDNTAAMKVLTEVVRKCPGPRPPAVTSPDNGNVKAECSRTSREITAQLQAERRKADAA